MRRRITGVLAALLAAAASLTGCGDAPAPAAPIHHLAVTLPAASLAVGEMLQATATALDPGGVRVTRPQLTWWSTDPAVASVTQAGVVRALAAGSALIVARTPETTAAAELRVVVPAVALVGVSPDSVTLVGGNGTQLTATLLSASGTPIAGRPVRWASSDSAVAVVSAAGVVTARLPGVASVTASSEGVSGRAVVVVSRLSNVNVTGVSPAVLSPGATAVVTGSGFAAARSGNAVTVGGLPAVVVAASPTQLTISLASSGYACEATALAPVVVTAGGELGATLHPLQPATQRSLAVGQSLVLGDPAQARCNEFAATGGRYFVAVVNASTLAGSVASFRLRGAASTAAVSRVPTIAPVPAPGAQRALRSVAAAATPEGAPAADQHDRLLDFNVRVADAAARRCDDRYTEVRARAVYSGRRVIILEDVAAPLAGTMDAQFARLGEEFDDVQYPIVESSFGNPLAMDARTDRNGRVIVLFTRAVNDRPGVSAFTLSCDFIPRTSGASASNEAEIIYAAVPTDPGEGFGVGAAAGRVTGTRESWRRRIRSTLVHELKHVASYAERLAANAPLEESWLEEATALIAEELWARTLYRLPPRANATYRQTLYCDRRPTAADCRDAPYAVYEHFTRLRGYLRGIEMLSPTLTDRSADPGATFYGSGWWLVRWSIDQSAAADATFLRALTASPTLTGAANLAARVGRAWPELLAEWTLATIVDDYPGFAPQSPQLAIASWNTRDIFAGLATDDAVNEGGEPSLGRPFPLSPRTLTFGDFSSEAVPVVAGSASIFEIAGAQSGRQLLELRGVVAAAAPASFVLAIVRVQ